MEKRKYSVYVHKVDTEDGPMYYAGMTSMKLWERWKPSAYKDNTVFKDYVNLYGWKNIEHAVAISDLSREDALKIEDKLICFYRSIGRSLNMVRSGLVESDAEYVKQRSHQNYLDNKEHYNELGRQYYINHKDEMSEYSKQYREAHKDEIKAYLANYRDEHREEAREYGRQYRAANKDKLKKKNSELYQKNREARIEYAKRYYQENKEKINARRRLKKQNDKKTTRGEEKTVS